MSSTQSFSLAVASGSGATYYSASGDMKIDYNNNTVFHVTTLAGSGAYATMNGSGKSILFPNSVAKPIKADLSFSIKTTGFSKGRFRLIIGGTQIYEHEHYSASYDDVTESGRTDTAIRNSNKNTEIKFELLHGGGSSTSIGTCTLTYYFTRYDFSATGENCTATVSSSTGYDGDTITYSCVLPGGATFDGWYNGSTRVSTSQSYTHTVNGADLSLTAKATVQVTKVLAATYNGAQLEGFPIRVTTDAPISYNGTSKGAVSFGGGIRRFLCDGKICGGNIVINGKTLQCTGKIMSSDVVAMIDINILDPNLFGMGNVTMSGGVYTFAPSTTAMLNQSLPAPVAGHKYYGRCYQMAPNGYSAADSRFEYYRIDGENLVFGNMDSTPKDGSWHLCSNILSLSSISSYSGWVLRSFTVSGTAPAYRKEMMIVDLTSMFGSGNEPTKSWCDANLIYMD